MDSLLVGEYSLWLALPELTLLPYWNFLDVVDYNSSNSSYYQLLKCQLWFFILLIFSALWKDTDRCNFVCCAIFNITKVFQVFCAPKILTDNAHVNIKGY